MPNLQRGVFIHLRRSFPGPWEQWDTAPAVPSTAGGEGSTPEQNLPSKNIAGLLSPILLGHGRWHPAVTAGSDTRCPQHPVPAVAWRGWEAAGVHVLLDKEDPSPGKNGSISMRKEPEQGRTRSYPWAGTRAGEAASGMSLFWNKSCISSIVAK